MDKSPLLSKTLWAALIVAITAFIPPVNAWIVANPSLYGSILAGVFAGLRLLTKGAISIE